MGAAPWTSGTAQATEGGGTTYPVSVATINPGLEPSPPGFTFLSYNTFHAASHTRNFRGGDALPGFHVSLEVTSARIDYTLPAGWHAGVSVVQPAFNQDLYTRFGNAGRKVSTAGLGDLTIAPLVIGYNGVSDQLGRFGVKFKQSIIFPTGDYNPSSLLNKGRNYFSAQPQIGVQFFPRPDITFGANLTYSYNTVNPATRYKSGQELILEPAAEYAVVPGVWAGVQGYAYRQLTSDRLKDVEAMDGHFGSAVAFGPQLRYWSGASRSPPNGSMKRSCATVPTGSAFGRSFLCRSDMLLAACADRDQTVRRAE